MTRRLLFLAGITVVASACKDDVTSLDLAGPPAEASISGGNGQTGRAGTALAQPLEVIVIDAAGRPVPAVAIHWSASGGTIPTVDSTGNDGVSRVTWVLPATPLGPATATATAGGGTLTFTATVLPPAGALVFRYIDAGSYHGCGITTSEELYCWGYNGDGQLGVAVSDPSLLPERIPETERFRLVSGGRYHSCGITLSGEAACWGENKDLRLGEREHPTTWQAIQAGYNHSCALSLARDIWCWGYDLEGEIGDGHPSLTDPPTRVGIGYKAVTVNGLHSCAIRESGSADCWGFNAEGQLGTGLTNRFDSLPKPVAGGITFRTDPTVVPPPPDPDFPLPPGPFIAAGYAHTCAIAASGGTFCWGLNQNGQLGNGGVNLSRVPVAASTPALVRITAGDLSTCAVTTTGVGYCWGDNEYGQLGDGTVVSKSVPTKIALQP